VRLGLKKLNDTVVREQQEIKISNRFAALEKLDDNMDKDGAWD
jgi:hypothetical protein